MINPKKTIYVLAAVSLAVSAYLLHGPVNAYQELEEDRALCGRVTIIDNSEYYIDPFPAEFYAKIYPVDDASVMRDKNGEIITDSEGSFAAPYLPPPAAFSERDLRRMTQHIPGCSGRLSTEIPEPVSLLLLLGGAIGFMFFSKL